MAVDGAVSSGGYTHEFLTEFIEIYRKHPCLWQVSCRGYKDRFMRNRAYNALVQKLRHVNPIADRDTVIRKINTLRTAFRREYKKVWNSQNSENDPLEWYRPSLWYYDKLKFVVEQNEEQQQEQQPQQQQPNPRVLRTYGRRPAVVLEEENCPYQNPKDESMQADGCQEEMMSQSQEGKTEPPSPIPTPSTSPNPLFQPVIVETAGNVSCTRRLRSSISPDLSRRKYHELYPESQPKDQMCESVQRQYPSCLTADQFDTFGHYVASKLRKSVSRQSSIAEKLIADVLLRASLGTLEENTCLAEQMPPRCFLVTGDR